MAVLGHTGKDHPCNGLISARGDRPPKFDSGRRTPLSCLPEEAVDEIIKTVKQNSKSSERMGGGKLPILAVQTFLCFPGTWENERLEDKE